MLWPDDVTDEELVRAAENLQDDHDVAVEKGQNHDATFGKNDAKTFKNPDF